MWYITLNVSFVESKCPREVIEAMGPMNFDLKVGLLFVLFIWMLNGFN